MQITITIPPHIEQAISQTNQSPEEVILQLLTQKFATPPAQSLENDPLIALFGSIHSDYPDLADQHDRYIGQAIYEEMNRNE
jgi:hypothetical protein